MNFSHNMVYGNIITDNYVTYFRHNMADIQLSASHLIGYTREL